MTTKNIRGILFDFDGVLADTMNDHFAAWNEALKQHGASVAPEVFFPLEGMPVPETAREMCRQAGVSDAMADEIMHRKERYYLTHHQCSFYPGVEECVLALHAKGVPMAIVSGGREERIRSSVPAEFLNKFAALIGSGSTPRGKPFPDPYLQGAQALGLGAGECVVVENAPLGIRAAKSAGAYCIAIASTVSREKLAGADEIIDSFAELRGTFMLKQLWQNIA